MRPFLRSSSQLLLLPALLLLLAAPADGQTTITCSSEDGGRHYCPADTSYGVDLTRQRSGSPCSEGYSWGADNRGVWVDHGCRADFVTRPAPPVTTCSSEDGRRHYCPAETRAGVQLLRQRSGSPCIQDQTWGFDDRGIWVDRGCRADFALQTGPSYDTDDANPPTVTCSSDDGGHRFCEADTRRGVRMLRQISGSPCVQGSTWDYDGRGIWVDRGCRAEFVLRLRHRDWDRDRDRDRDNDGGNRGTFAQQTITCSSDDGGRHYCSAETRSGVRLVNQRSGSPCTKDYSWGFDDRGIWVDHGCRADFALENGLDYGSQEACSRTAGYERAQQMVNQCLQISAATHPPCNAQNSCSLIISEIRRNCALLGRDAPPFCANYR